MGTPQFSNFVNPKSYFLTRNLLVRLRPDSSGPTRFVATGVHTEASCPAVLRCSLLTFQAQGLIDVISVAEYPNR